MHYGALAFIFALGLIFTQSAFTTKTLTPNYYLDQNEEWQPIDALVEGSTPGTYRCDEDVDPTRICKAYFATENPQPDTPPTSDIVYGEFILN